jgi:uncharacterized protein (DUF697 family)
MTAEAVPDLPVPVADPRRAAADAVVMKYVPWSMGLGFVPIPFAVAAGLTGIQVKMLSDISRIYGVPFSHNGARGVLLALLGGIGAPWLAGAGLTGLVASIPVIGPFIFPATQPLLTGAATYAIGRTFQHHFESGGTYENFDVLGARDLFKERFAEGKAYARKYGAATGQKLSSAVEL